MSVSRSRPRSSVDSSEKIQARTLIGVAGRYDRRTCGAIKSGSQRGNRSGDRRRPLTRSTARSAAAKPMGGKLSDSLSQVRGVNFHGGRQFEDRRRARIERACGEIAARLRRDCGRCDDDRHQGRWREMRGVIGRGGEKGGEGGRGGRGRGEALRATMRAAIKGGAPVAPPRAPPPPRRHARPPCRAPGTVGSS